MWQCKEWGVQLCAAYTISSISECVGKHIVFYNVFFFFTNLYLKVNGKLHHTEVKTCFEWLGSKRSRAIDAAVGVNSIHVTKVNTQLTIASEIVSV